MTLVNKERQLYEDVFATIGNYGEYSPGELYVPMFLDMAKPPLLPVGKHHVLDAGTGVGKSAMALANAGFTVECCDLDDHRLPEFRFFAFHRACLWEPFSGEWDYAYCCDVMEHIPKEFTMLAIARLLESVRRGAFFSVTFLPDNFGVFVGQPLHQTVETFTWWRDRFSTLGRLVESRDLLNSGVYYVEPR
jgi:methyltransferase family protein